MYLNNIFSPKVTKNLLCSGIVVYYGVEYSEGMSPLDILQSVTFLFYTIDGD